MFYQIQSEMCVTALPSYVILYGITITCTSATFPALTMAFILSLCIRDAFQEVKLRWLILMLGNIALLSIICNSCGTKTDKYSHFTITYLKCYQGWIKRSVFPKKELIYHSPLPLQSKAPKTICVKNIPGACLHPVTLKTHLFKESFPGSTVDAKKRNNSNGVF